MLPINSVDILYCFCFSLSCILKCENVTTVIFNKKILFCPTKSRRVFDQPLELKNAIFRGSSRGDPVRGQNIPLVTDTGAKLQVSEKMGGRGSLGRDFISLLF